MSVFQGVSVFEVCAHMENQFSFAAPEQDWRIHGGWFTEQDNFRVRLGFRNRDAELEDDPLAEAAQEG